jgi:ubiquinone/menaquinone biosynthesis C-methylase UbiE
MDALYSLENAKKFGWASITGNLNETRAALLETELVGEKILDVGCSGGGYSEFVAKRRQQVVGLEKYFQFLNYGVKKGHKALYVQGDVTALPFADKSFDSTYCFDVLEHVDEKSALQELARVTEKRLILIVPQESPLLERCGLTFSHYIDSTHLRYYNESSLKQSISIIPHTGISVIPIQPIHWDYVLQTLVEDVPTTWFESVLDPRILMRILKYALHNKRMTGTTELRSSYKKARKNKFFKMASQAEFAPLYAELIAVIDLACARPIAE